MPASISYLRHVACPLLWMSVPLLQSTQHDDVISAATNAMAALMRLDQAFSQAFIWALSELILQKHPLERKDSVEYPGRPLSIWAAIVTEPRIISVHTREFFSNNLRCTPIDRGEKQALTTCVPNCDQILSIYCSDYSLGLRLREIYLRDVSRGLVIGQCDLPTSSNW